MRSLRLWFLLAGGFAFGLLGASGVLHVAGVDLLGRAGGSRSAGVVQPAQTPSASPISEPTPTPLPATASSAAPAFTPGQSLFATSQIVSYYGHPLSAAMGVLGEGSEQEMLERLKMQAAEYQALNPA